MWEKSSQFLQLPHVSEDILKHFSTRKRHIRSLTQLAKMKDEDRRSLLRTLTDEQYRDVIRVLSLLPDLSVLSVPFVLSVLMTMTTITTTQ